MQEDTAKTKKDKTTLLMTDGNIWKLLIVFSIPLILGNLLQQMYNTADSIIVGNFVGSNGLAAVGAGTALINLIIAFAQGAAVGAGVVVSQYLGANRKQQIKISVHTSMCIAIILGIILTLLGVFLSPSLLVLMKTPKEVLKSSSLYLQIYCGGLIFNVIYNMATGILNAAGNSRKPLVYLAVASVTNIILDLLLIKVFKLGVMGAAIATDISQALSCVLALGYLFRVKSDYKLCIKELKINKDIAFKIIKIGLPTAIQNMVISFSNVLVQSSVNMYGATAMAGYAAYLKIDGFGRGVYGTVSLYIAIYLLGSKGLKLALMLPMGIGTAVGTLLVNLVLKKFSTKKTFILFCCYGASALAILFLVSKGIGFNSNLIVPFLILNFFCGIQHGNTNVTPNIMIADCVDEMEYKTGKRQEGLAYAGYGLFSKIASAFTKFLGPWLVYTWSQYKISTDPNVAYASQDNTVLSRFLMIYTIVPAIFVILQFIPILFYDMTGEKKARITAALAEKRENESKEKADADEVKKEYEELSEEISE